MEDLSENSDLNIDKFLDELLQTNFEIPSMPTAGKMKLELTLRINPIAYLSLKRL